MKKLTLLIVAALVVASTCSALPLVGTNALKLSVGGFVNVNNEGSCVTAGPEITASTQVATNRIGEVDVLFSQAYGITLDGQKDSSGITSVGASHTLERLNCPILAPAINAVKSVGLTPYVEGRASFEYGERKPNWYLTPSIGVQRRLSSRDALYAQAGYNVSIANRNDGISIRFGLCRTF